MLMAGPDWLPVRLHRTAQDCSRRRRSRSADGTHVALLLSGDDEEHACEDRDRDGAHHEWVGFVSRKDCKDGRRWKRKETHHETDDAESAAHDLVERKAAYINTLGAFFPFGNRRVGTKVKTVAWREASRERWRLIERLS